MKLIILASIVGIVFVAGIVFWLGTMVWSDAPPPDIELEGVEPKSDESKVSKAACGAEDPVSDPAYNMREICKQSILLEEHLVEKPKHCKDCISKHFLHIIGLSEEAQCLAGSRISEYPLMASNARFYNTLFEKWLKDRDGERNQHQVEDQLRARRKQLVQWYVLGNPIDEEAAKDTTSNHQHI